MGRNNKPAHFYKPQGKEELVSLATQIVTQASTHFSSTGRPMKGIPGLKKPRKK